MTLSLIDHYYACKLSGMEDRAKEAIKLIDDILINFESTYERYNLKQYKISRKDFVECIKPTIEKAKYNVVTRAAKRVAASHLCSEPGVQAFPVKDREVNAFTDHS